MKKIIYIDMDSVLCDYLGHAQELGVTPGEAKLLDGFFRDIRPMPGAIEAFERLSDLFDVYILTTAPWSNPSAWSDKLLWVQEHLTDVAYKRLIISHHKQLCTGDYLIDDSPRNGARDFSGEWIQFGSERFPDWPSVTAYLEAALQQEFEAYLDSRIYYTKGTVEELLMTISKFELLIPEEETEAIKKALCGDREALESLIAANMRYCVSIANQYKEGGLDLMQLTRIAERSIARSVMTFDPRKGVSFAGHAVKGMRSDLISYI